VLQVSEWPDLPFEPWRPTKETLHRYTQVIGKVRLALSPFEPEWANVPLYVTARGLTTSPVPSGTGTFDAEFDLFDHVLVLRTSEGGLARVALRGAVADFYRAVMEALAGLGVSVHVSELPSEIPDPIPFPVDREHHTYDGAQAVRGPVGGGPGPVPAALRRGAAGAGPAGRDPRVPHQHLRGVRLPARLERRATVDRPAAAGRGQLLSRRSPTGRAAHNCRP